MFNGVQFMKGVHASFGNQKSQDTQTGPAALPGSRAACNTRVMTLQIRRNERFVRVEKSVSCVFTSRGNTSTLPPGTTFSQTFCSRNFAILPRANPSQTIN